jgi:hypothetical protein
MLLFVINNTTQGLIKIVKKSLFGLLGCRQEGALWRTLF